MGPVRLAGGREVGVAVRRGAVVEAAGRREAGEPALLVRGRAVGADFADVGGRLAQDVRVVTLLFLEGRARRHGTCEKKPEERPGAIFARGMHFIPKRAHGMLT